MSQVKEECCKESMETPTSIKTKTSISIKTEPLPDSVSSHANSSTKESSDSSEKMNSSFTELAASNTEVPSNECPPTQKESCTVTEEMKAEEAKLHEETVKEEEQWQKEQEDELHKMNEEMREQRYKRLQFLLTKSNMYTHYLLKRMQGQKEIEEKKNKIRLARRQKEIENRKDEGVEKENSAETTHETSTNTKNNLENEGAENKSEGIATRRTPRRSAALSTLQTSKSSGKGGQESKEQGKPKRGKKRKAEENVKITDMFAEAIERNKRRKENTNEQHPSEKENTHDGETSSQESQVSQKQIPAVSDEFISGERFINGEKVNDLQPDLFSGGVLRDYQIEGFRWLKVLYENGVNGILADEMGLGKTIQCIAVIAKLIDEGLAGPYLVVAPLSTLPNWVSEFERFTPKLKVILYHGTQEDRVLKRNEIMKVHNVRDNVTCHPILITSYEIAMNDRKFIGNYPWKYLIVDEGHRIKNFQCRLIKELRVYKSTHRLLLTGTPLQNNLQELWSLLNFLLPEIFDDLGSFEAWFDISFLQSESSNSAIVQEEAKDSILTMLHQILSPFMLRRLKADVALNIPPKREVLVYAPLAQTQRDQYRTIVDKTIRKLVEGDEKEEIASFEVDQHGRSKRRRKSRFSKDQMSAIMELENGKVKEEEDEGSEVEEWFNSVGDLNNNSSERCPQLEPKSRHLNIQLRNTMFMLRKCVNHPYLIDYPLTPSGDYRIDNELLTASGKLMMLDRMLGELKKNGHKVLIFSQMTKILDVLEDFCYLKQYQFCRLDGSMKIEDRREQISDFNKNPELFIFLLSTRAGGLGINLTAADTVIIFDSDWNPQCDLQAQDRAHRIGQTKPVIVYRLITANTIDQKIVERAAAKRKLEKMVITKGKFKSGGCWNSNEVVGDEPPKKEVKVMSALSPDELLELLKSTDYDEKVQCESDVISNKDLEKLLDRSDLWEIMRKKKSANDPESENSKDLKKEENSVEKYKDRQGVFKVIDEDMGGNSACEKKDA